MRDNIRDVAEKIVEVLSYCRFDDVTDDSGYYTIKKYDNGSENSYRL